jgi:hypothetical protein
MVSARKTSHQNTWDVCLRGNFEKWKKCGGLGSEVHVIFGTAAAISAVAVAKNSGNKTAAQTASRDVRLQTFTFGRSSTCAIRRHDCEPFPLPQFPSLASNVVTGNAAHTQHSDVRFVAPSTIHGYTTQLYHSASYQAALEDWAACGAGLAEQPINRTTLKSHWVSMGQRRNAFKKHPTVQVMFAKQPINPEGRVEESMFTFGGHSSPRCLIKIIVCPRNPKLVTCFLFNYSHASFS